MPCMYYLKIQREIQPFCLPSRLQFLPFFSINHHSSTCCLPSRHLLKIFCLFSKAFSKLLITCLFHYHYLILILTFIQLAKKLFGFFCMIICKNPNKLSGQPNICKKGVFQKMDFIYHLDLRHIIPLSEDQLVPNSGLNPTEIHPCTDGNLCLSLGRYSYFKLLSCVFCSQIWISVR